MLSHQTDSKPKPTLRSTRSSTRRFFYRFLPSRLCPPPPTISGPRRRSWDTTAFVWVSEPIRLIKDGYLQANYLSGKWRDGQGSVFAFLSLATCQGATTVPKTKVIRRVLLRNLSRHSTGAPRSRRTIPSERHYELPRLQTVSLKIVALGFSYAQSFTTGGAPKLKT